MKRYRSKPIFVEAVVWDGLGAGPFDETGAAVVGKYQPKRGGDDKETCKLCGAERHQHGWIQTITGGYTVCPGDMIIRNTAGEFCPNKPGAFNAVFEEIRHRPGEIVK